MSITALVKRCCEVVRSELDEHDVNDVLVCMEKSYAKEIAEYAEQSARKMLRGLIKNELKRSASADLFDRGPQLSLAGFDSLPMSLSFYDGQRVRYISIMRARPGHLRGAIKLREDQASFNDAMAQKFKNALDLILRLDRDNATFGDALQALQDQEVPGQDVNPSAGAPSV